jgi:hypothetical protein
LPPATSPPCRPRALEKAGVFAVRMGAPLADNLRRSALGEALRPIARSATGWR